MLSGVGFSELLLLFVIGLLILGPERLPRVASQIGRWVGKARRTANQLRFQMEREIALADIERTQSKKKTEKDTGSTSGPAAATPGDAEPGASTTAGTTDGAESAPESPGIATGESAPASQDKS